MNKEQPKEVNVYWSDENRDYHAYPKKYFKKPVITEKDGCWEVTINKKIPKLVSF